jgi:serine/threonine-protein kinase
VAVPNLVGLTGKEAQAVLAKAGLTLKSTGDPTQKALSQVPAANGKAAKGSAVTVTFATAPTLVAVPNLVGLTGKEAQAALTKAGLTLKSTGDATQKAKSQTPTATAKVAKGSSVQVTFPPPVTTVAVPNVVQLSGKNAEAAVTKAGLKFKSSGDPNSGPATSQSPAAGAKAKTGDTVVVTFSPALIKVPSVVGQSQAVALSALSGAGLTMKTSGDTSQKALSQSPAAGAQVKKGSAVTVTFPAPLVRVPNVFGKTPTAARAALTEAKLTMTAQGDATGGTATSQNPQAGTSVKPGSAVSVTFQPALVKVPAVVGQTQGGAQAILSQARLGISVRGDSSQGKAISQAPSAGTQVKPGSTVTVTFPTKPAAPPQVTVPNVIGRNLQQARSTLQGAGLQVSTTGNTAGTVRSQNPPAGRQVPRNSTVTLTLQ